MMRWSSSGRRQVTTGSPGVGRESARRLQPRRSNLAASGQRSMTMPISIRHHGCGGHLFQCRAGVFGGLRVRRRVYDEVVA
jgi:hypothetical protein